MGEVATMATVIQFPGTTSVDPNPEEQRRAPKLNYMAKTTYGDQRENWAAQGRRDPLFPDRPLPFPYSREHDTDK